MSTAIRNKFVWKTSSFPSLAPTILRSRLSSAKVSVIPIRFATRWPRLFPAICVVRTGIISGKLLTTTWTRHCCAAAGPRRLLVAATWLLPSDTRRDVRSLSPSYPPTNRPSNST
jgi:hypothetical protein